VESREVARLNKIAARQGRVIVFIDESSLSERPVLTGGNVHSLVLGRRRRA
jgi:hypothetical protein